MYAEPSTLVIGIVFLMLISSIAMICYFIQRRIDERKLILEPDEPIIYPEHDEPMFDNFESIRTQLRLVCNPYQLRKLYTRIVLFDIFYKDSPTFYNELVELYNSVEAEYLNPI